MSKEKKKGSAFEEQVAGHMRLALQDERIERRVSNGANDRGDIAGVYMRGKRVVVECKNHRKMELSQWLDEAEEERGNDDAEWGVVVHKRRGCGERNMGKTYVTMTLDTFEGMIAGSRRLLCYTADERGDGRFMAREDGVDEWG